MKFFLCLLSLVWITINISLAVDGEGEDVPLPQPDVIESPLSLQCCHLVGDSASLQTCVSETSFANNFLRKSATKKSMVSMYTYVSENIMKYSAYSTMVNLVYAEHNRYDFHILGLNKSNDLYADSPDHRWNKVHILWEALKAEPDTVNSRFVRA